MRASARQGSTPPASSPSGGLWAPGRAVTFTHVVRVMGTTSRRFVTVDLDGRGPLSCLVTADGMVGALVTVSPDQRYRLRRAALALVARFAEVPTVPRLPREQDGNHLPECTDTDCVDGCEVELGRVREYRAGHEWHEGAVSSTAGE